MPDLRDSIPASQARSRAESSPDVSFVMLTYNQEQFVRSAVQSALAQTHTPLEVILSDDCSQDGTFEIMQEIVEAYRGPHSVILRRNSQNIGLIEHVNLVFEIARGSLLVMAAGDDISLPNRVAAMVPVFESQNPLVIHSDAVVIDRDGNLLGPYNGTPLFLESIDPREAALSESLYLGATAGLNKELVMKYGKLRYAHLFEDLIFGFRAALEQRVVYLDEPLIMYREGTGVSYPQPSSVREVLDIRVRRLRRRADTFLQRKEDVQGSDQALDLSSMLDRKAIEFRVRYLLYVSPPRAFAQAFTRGGVAMKAIWDELNFIASRLVRRVLLRWSQHASPESDESRKP